jgi:hypothetical protein
MAHCENTTENDNFCHPPEVIDETLKGLNMYFEYYSASYAVDHYDMHNPQYRVVNDFFYTYTERFNTIKYISDEGIVFEDMKTHEAFEYDESTFNVVIYNKGISTFIENSFSLIQFNINNRFSDQYQRSYQKLQDVVANIGGLVDFVRLCAEVIGGYISLQKFYIDMSNHIIKHEEINDIELKNLTKPITKQSKEINKIENTDNLLKIV